MADGASRLKDCLTYVIHWIDRNSLTILWALFVSLTILQYQWLTNFAETESEQNANVHKLATSLYDLALLMQETDTDIAALQTNPEREQEIKALLATLQAERESLKKASQDAVASLGEFREATTKDIMDKMVRQQEVLQGYFTTFVAVFGIVIVVGAIWSRHTKAG